MPEPEVAEIEYAEGTSYVRCPCRETHLYLPCLNTGEIHVDGLNLLCDGCGRVLNADGVVIGRVKLSA